MKRRSFKCGTSSQLTEPKSSFKDGVVQIADAVLNPDKKGLMLLPVHNYAKFPARLRRGQALGWIQPAELVMKDGEYHPSSYTSQENPPPGTTATTQPPPPAAGSVRLAQIEDPHKRRRCETIVTELELDMAIVSSTEAEALEALLVSNADIFDLNNSLIGWTEVTRHTIDTGGHPPTNQPPHRTPFAFCHQVDSMVKEMLDRGLSNPCAVRGPVPLS